MGGEESVSGDIDRDVGGEESVSGDIDREVER